MKKKLIPGNQLKYIFPIEDINDIYKDQKCFLYKMNINEEDSTVMFIDEYKIKEGDCFLMMPEYFIHDVTKKEIKIKNKIINL